ncbi:hypothetical protein PYS58_01240 [Chryseobacterium indologenes]|uniref:hypothetical protein n=1 Tax=Chryseobacterium indologenes TaxID=253 RepID=UPI0023E82F08|nr:hypothetical protein [Chryseobacterium indologenes]WET49759.1 hypothetical protein PYS58_01240 [Chryseobacterium indologenes]
MKKAQRKYQITKGETISTVASKLGLSVAELVYYHNLHSKTVDEYIYGEFLPEKLKYILIPMSYEQEISISPEFEYSNTKVVKTIGKTMKKYGITQRYFNHEELVNVVDFEADISEEVQDELCVTIFNKHFVRINKSDNLRLIEQLYGKIDKCLYPLKISSNKDGSFKSIVNSKEIKERWILLRPELEEYYQGETSSEILSAAEEILGNTELYASKLLNSFFFKIWHGPIYRNYREGEEIEYEDRYLIFPQHEEVQFKMKLEADLKISENNKFIIWLTGTCTDRRSELELWNAPSDALVNKNPENKVKGNISMLFKMNETDKRIFSVVGFIELQGKIHHKRIEIGIYEL